MFAASRSSQDLASAALGDFNRAQQYVANGGVPQPGAASAMHADTRPLTLSDHSRSSSSSVRMASAMHKRRKLCKGPLMESFSAADAKAFAAKARAARAQLGG
jgi:hypothetical protein